MAGGLLQYGGRDECGSFCERDTDADENEVGDAGEPTLPESEERSIASAIYRTSSRDVFERDTDFTEE